MYKIRHNARWGLRGWDVWGKYVRNMQRPPTYFTLTGSLNTDAFISHWNRKEA